MNSVLNRVRNLTSIISVLIIHVVRHLGIVNSVLSKVRHLGTVNNVVNIDT